MSLRYVILKHEGIDEPHVDLMFETSPGSQLATWRSPIWPIDQPTEVQRLRDHRRMYLDYEGPIPGDRGFVMRVDSGTCSVTSSNSGARFEFQLSDGKRLTFEQSGEFWQLRSECA